MTNSPFLDGLILLFALLALWFAFRSARAFRRRRLVGGAFNVASTLVMALLAACLALLGIGLQGFNRLTYERTAAEVALAKTGERSYVARVRYPDGGGAEYPLSGDEWQIDARMLTFRPLATILGFDSAYRLERIGGRYRSVEDERSQPRTVHALEPATPPVDLWTAARQWHQWLPWIDAYYGSGAYVPMADGATYAVAISQTGVRVRPMNEPARLALASWR